MATYIISGILLVVVGLVVARMIRQRKQRISCGGGCSGCPYSGRCQKYKN